MNELFSIAGKVAVITGAGGVLGGNIAQHFVQQGAKVVAIDIRQEQLDNRVAELKQYGNDVIGIIGNVLDIASLEKVAEEVVAKWGQIDILLNIAGGNMPGATLEPEQQGKGCIINVSSMAAYSAITRVPGYSAAKTAVANFTQWLASEMALKYGDGIRVNAIAPGFFIGDQNRRVLINPDGSLTDRSKKVLAKTPMKRFGDIKELNGAVHFLCSEAASFVTGAMLPIDGGFSAFSGV